MDVQELHRRIDNIVRERSKALHEGNRVAAAQLDNDLIDLMILLPDNKPKFAPFIELNGVKLALQSIIGDKARYVRLINWSSEAMVYAPTDRRIRLETERSKSREVLRMIQDMEAVNKNPVEEGDVERSHHVGIQGQQEWKLN